MARPRKEPEKLASIKSALVARQKWVRKAYGRAQAEVSELLTELMELDSVLGKKGSTGKRGRPKGTGKRGRPRGSKNKPKVGTKKKGTSPRRKKPTSVEAPPTE